MAKLDVIQLCEMSGKQFQLQSNMKSLWQVLADNFYPERADFTFTRNVGAEFADSLIDSYPLLIRRDLGNSLHAMLRDDEWFQMTVDGDPDYAGEYWLREKTRHLRKLMYKQESGFIRACKEGDHDYVTFGQNVKSVEMNRKTRNLLFRCWHLRDCAWFEDENGMVCGVIRQGKMNRRDMCAYFGEKAVHPKVYENLLKEPWTEFETLHFCIPSKMYGDEKIEGRFPYVSIFVDATHKHLMEETGQQHKTYVVPRFQTIAGSAYAYSPATTVGLSDARCLQAMTHTLMEAAERYARPPIVATTKAVRSDVDLGSDGITWVDEAYDERMGAALRVLNQDKSGYPIGDNERQRVMETLQSAFYLNKLKLPDPQHGDMTAYEVSERMKEYRRENLPLFAPIEAEDNGQVCDLAFEVAMTNNLLGSHYDIPPSLRGAQVDFQFESPLTASENERIAQRFSQTRDMLASVVELDPSIGHDVDLSSAIRDAVMGIGAPVGWLTDPESAAQARQADVLAQQAQQTIAAVAADAQ